MTESDVIETLNYYVYEFSNNPFNFLGNRATRCTTRPIRTNQRPLGILRWWTIANWPQCPSSLRMPSIRFGFRRTPQWGPVPCPHRSRWRRSKVSGSKLIGQSASIRQLTQKHTRTGTRTSGIATTAYGIECILQFNCSTQSGHIDHTNYLIIMQNVRRNVCPFNEIFISVCPHTTTPTRTEPRRPNQNVCAVLTKWNLRA